VFRLPHRRPARLPLAGLAVLTAAGLTCAAGLPAQAAPAGSRAVSTRAAAPPGAVRSSSLRSPVRRLLLLNGDRLMVRTGPDGRLDVGVRAATAHDEVTALRFGGQVTELPADAMPYLGRGLSPSLFLLSALEKAESGGRLPVEVGYTGTRPAIPGLTITRSGFGHADGYLTAASARVFGAALWRQFVADHARGTYGGRGLFGDGVRLTLAGSPLAAASSAAPAARPGYRMHTLTMRATNLRGKPDSGDEVFITSADNVARFDGLQETDNVFYKGTAKFSVPSGHYWALATFFSFSGDNAYMRMVVLPQFTVNGRHTTVRLSERAASSKVTFRIPRPGVNQQESFEVVRDARTGGSFTNDNIWSGITTWISPTTRKPTVGRLNAYTEATYTSPAKAASQYAYNLDYPSPAGTISRQQFTATPASLGSVTEHYYQDVPTGDGGWMAFGGTPAQLAFEFVPVLQVRMPSVQTQYFSADHDLLWQVETLTSLNQFSGGDNDLYRWFSGGQASAENWNAYPLHPAADATLGGPSAAVPVQTSAGRSGNVLSLGFTPWSDNTFGHTGPGFYGNGNALVTGTYQVDQNGKRIARGSALNGIPGIRLSAAPSVVSFTLNADRYSSFFQLSSGSSTTWTWHSARDAAARVPRAWYCGLKFTSNSIRYLRQCAVQPLMSLSYQVQGMSTTGQTRPGPQAVEVTAGHIQLGGSAKVTGATAQVSFNDGDSWFPAKVTAQGGGRFRVTYSAPAGVDVTLRVSASDAAGGSISETIVRGYGVSG
jgi:hypothetical protein